MKASMTNRILGTIINVLVLFCLAVPFAAAQQAPVIDPVTVSPDPDFALAGAEYHKELTLSVGPATAWTVVDGPPGTVVEPRAGGPIVPEGAIVRGWAPGAGDLGRTVSIEIQAENDFGTDIVSWSVEVAGLDVTPFGSPIALVTAPLGGGSPDIEVIRDGIRPPVVVGENEGDSAQQYDTYDGANAATEDEDWIGYEFPREIPFERVIFTEGKHFFDGGWMTTDVDAEGPPVIPVSVQVRVGGVWTDVADLVITPDYEGRMTGGDIIAFQTFSLSFTPLEGDAVRLRGDPGGTRNTDFFSVAELRVGEAPVGAAPVASIGATPTEGPPPLEVTFDGSGSSDPDGSVVGLIWDFDAADGIQADATGPSVSHTYDTVGDYRATLIVTDDTGNVAWTAVEIAVNLPPIIEDVPDGTALVFNEYGRQLVLTQGHPAPTWELVSGPPGLVIDDATGLLSGWVPGSADVGQVFTIQVRAENPVGSDMESWQVEVTDSVRDDFDPPTLDPVWEWYVPVAGPTISLDTIPGLLRIAVDSSRSYDHWSGVNAAPQLRRSDMGSGSFAIETRMNASGTTGSPYHAGLMVYFDTLNIFYWGIYTGNRLRLERSGMGGMIEVAYTSAQVYLRIEKTGDEYSFLYRSTTTEDWILAGMAFAPEPVQYVGVILKTWGAINAAALFDYFEMESGEAAAPVLEDVEDQDVYPDIEYRRHVRLLAGYPAPSLELVEGPPGLSIDPAGLLSGWTPQAADLGTSYNIQVRASNPVGEVTVSWLVTVAEPVPPTDDFDGPDLAPEWEWYAPLAGPFYSFSDRPGWLRLGVPQTPDFDHWSSADDAPQIRRADLPAENWTISTELTLADYTSGQPFHVGLMVLFTQLDIFYWGPYAGTNLRLERSGEWNLAGRSVLSETVYLRIIREGTEYHFEYKELLYDSWVRVTTVTKVEEPLNVGLILKTWGAGTQAAADFAWFDGPGAGPGPDTPEFIRMDLHPVDAPDGKLGLSDVIWFLSSFLFGQDKTLNCPDAADSNDDGKLGLTDAIYMLSILFLPEGKKPPTHPPFPDCGEDPTADDFDGQPVSKHGKCVYSRCP